MTVNLNAFPIGIFGFSLFKLEFECISEQIFGFCRRNRIYHQCLQKKMIAMYPSFECGFSVCSSIVMLNVFVHHLNYFGFKSHKNSSHPPVHDVG